MKSKTSLYLPDAAQLRRASRAAWALWMIGVIGSLAPALATDLTIHLPRSASLSRQTVQYTCDATGAKIGVPTGPFSVEYINGGGNSLAVVPVGGHSLIFANVLTGSGARYVAQQYTWWEAKGDITLISDSLAGKQQSSCHRTNRN